ncbi:site-specific integrase [Nitratireductor sp. XY-223]|uniref:tyrosine-type recombinase/integrase n=1 Tax=Nitratireductor sp. XY-223 TaxID=2561926 RepID=UPI0010AB0A8A|nr:site-specific integrase [Nitratireductor sp. XY-223]
MVEKHTIENGKVHIYKRLGSPIWQCSTYLAGKNRRVSTKQDDLQEAKGFAKGWYEDLLSKQEKGEVVKEKTFTEAAKQFEREYEIMTEGERNAKYVADHMARLRNHLVPYFGAKGLSEIKPGLVQKYRMFRLQSPPKADPNRRFKKPSRTTMLHEMVTLRQVLKTAVRHGWLEMVPDLSMPYRKSAKVSHRAWFSPEEYETLYTATRENIKRFAETIQQNELDKKQYLHNLNPKRNKHQEMFAAQLHDLVLFLANTGLRPDEAKCLQFRDVTIVQRKGKKSILEIEVRGKRGVGYCKSTLGAVEPFRRLQERHLERNNPQPTDLVFPHDHKRQFNQILGNLGLKKDRDGNTRTLYSLRHTYISMRLMNGADIYQLAKNCRTSVEMIEKHYASHLKNRIDEDRINVYR